jgi:hypothetical protein
LIIVTSGHTSWIPNLTITCRVSSCASSRWSHTFKDITI